MMRGDEDEEEKTKKETSLNVGETSQQAVLQKRPGDELPPDDKAAAKKNHQSER